MTGEDETHLQVLPLAPRPLGEDTGVIFLLCGKDDWALGSERHCLVALPGSVELVVARRVHAEAQMNNSRNGVYVVHLVEINTIFMKHVLEST